MLNLSEYKRILKFIFILILPITVYIIAFLCVKYSHGSLCLWKNIFNFDCPGCGITRAFLAVCRLDFDEAYRYNSKIFIVIPVFVFIWLEEIVKTIKTR